MIMFGLQTWNILNLDDIFTSKQTVASHLVVSQRSLASVTRKFSLIKPLTDPFKLARTVLDDPRHTSPKNWFSKRKECVASRYLEAPVYAVTSTVCLASVALRNIASWVSDIRRVDLFILSRVLAWREPLKTTKIGWPKKGTSENCQTTKVETDKKWSRH